MLLYKKHPEKFKKANEFFLGFSSHMFWPYVMLGPLFLFLLSLWLMPSLSPYSGLTVALVYPWVVFFHTRMRSNIDQEHIAKHPIKFLGLFCVWWIAILWDTYQRIKAIIVFKKVLI